MRVETRDDAKNKDIQQTFESYRIKYGEGKINFAAPGRNRIGNFLQL